MPYIIVDNGCFEGEEYDSAREIEGAISKAISDGYITLSKAEELEVREVTPVSCKIEVTVSVSID